MLKVTTPAISYHKPIILKVIYKLCDSEKKFKSRGSAGKSRVRQEHFPSEQLYLVPKHPNQIKKE